jgi:hypothetical protein
MVLDLGFASIIILSVKVKVLRGGFSLWLGDNIAIFFMVKQEHLLFLMSYGPTLYLDSLTTGKYIGRIFLVIVVVADKFFDAAMKP